MFSSVCVRELFLYGFRVPIGLFWMLVLGMIFSMYDCTIARKQTLLNKKRG
jgi:hypothetical protein